MTDCIHEGTQNEQWGRSKERPEDRAMLPAAARGKQRAAARGKQRVTTVNNEQEKKKCQQTVGDTCRRHG